MYPLSDDFGKTVLSDSYIPFYKTLNNGLKNLK